MQSDFTKSGRKSKTKQPSLFVRRLRMGIVRTGLVSLVVADRAARGGTGLAMSRHVTGDATHDRALDTSFGTRTPDGS
jgi:hypothetical protein